MEKTENNISLESLHPDFNISVDGNWLWNKNPGLCEGGIDRKVLFLFNEQDRELLGDCPSVAKIGINTATDTQTQYKYIGFVYGDKDSEGDIISFAKRFQKAKKITGLTSSWGSKENSVVTEL